MLHTTYEYYLYIDAKEKGQKNCPLTVNDIYFTGFAIPSVPVQFLV